MAAKEIRVGDVGSAIRGTVRDQSGSVYDVSFATTLQFIFIKPDESQVTKNVVFVNTGTDGLIQYVWQTGDLDLAGLWRIQVYVVTPDQTLRSDFKNFRVHPNL